MIELPFDIEQLPGGRHFFEGGVVTRSRVDIGSIVTANDKEWRVTKIQPVMFCGCYWFFVEALQVPGLTPVDF